MSVAKISALLPAAPAITDHPPPYQPNPAVAVHEQVAELKAQNTRLLGMLERMIMHGSASSIVVANTTAVDSAPANTTAAPSPPVGHDQAGRSRPDSTTVNLFGRESLEHVTSKHIKAILDDGLRVVNGRRPPGYDAPTWAAIGAENQAAMCTMESARVVAVKTAQLIYNDPDHPENLTWYTLDRLGRHMTHTERGWEIFPIIGTTQKISDVIHHTIIGLLNTKQPTDDMDKYAHIMACMNLQSHEKLHQLNVSSGRLLHGYLTHHELYPGDAALNVLRCRAYVDINQTQHEVVIT